MKTSPRLLVAIEASIKLAAIAVLARVLWPAVGVLAGRLLTSFTTAAFRSPALGILGLVLVVHLCLAAALVAILIPLKMVRARPANGGDRRNDERV